MSSFSLSGGVEVTGYISPTDTNDTYPVIDPLYGIDGFRNVNLITDLNLIPEPRRRAGMVVGVSGGTTYYKLNSSPWNNTISDWSLFNTGGGSVSGDYLPLSGGTVTGSTTFTSGLFSNTISATTYQNLPTDIRVTGGTYSAGTATFRNNTGGTFNVTGFTDTYVTGATFSGTSLIIYRNENQPNINANIPTVSLSGSLSSVTFNIATSGSLSATTYLGLPTDVRVTGGTYVGSTITFTNNTGGTFTVTGITSSTTFTGGTVSGSTIFQNGLTANTISATTYQNLPTDIIVTGGTYSAGTITFTNNTGGTFNVTGLTTGSTSTTIGGNFLPLSGGTVTGGTIFNSGLTANTLSATTYQNLPTDIRVTGGTYSSGTATFTNNTGGTFTVTGFSTGGGETFTGGTVSGATVFQNGLTANTISATTYQNLPLDIRVTGGTFSSGTITFRNNTGGTFNVTGITSADTFTTAFTYSNNVFTIGRNQNQPSLTATINTVTGWTVNGVLTVTGNTSLQVFTATTATVSGNLTVAGSSALNGTISSTNLAGPTNRVVQVNSGGTISATADIITAYITSGGTAANLLENGTNWNINGVYTGTTITGTFQGQKHYDLNYFYEAVADNLFIRLIRG